MVGMRHAPVPPPFLMQVPGDLEQQMAARGVQRLVLRAGETLGLATDTDEVLLAGAGAKVVLHGNCTLMTCPPPAVIGLLECIVDNKEMRGLRAGEDIACYRMSRPELYELANENEWLRTYLTWFFETILRDGYRRELSYQQNFEDYFLPGSALLLPGPYKADTVDMILLVMEDDPDRIRNLLPPHMFPVPFCRDRYMLVFSHFKDMTTDHHIGENKSFNYRETAMFLPALSTRLRANGAFCPELFPDNYLAITLGRELYGFPKRHAETYMPGNAHHVQLIGHEHVDLEAKWSGAKPISAQEFTRAFATDMMGDARWVSFLGGLGGAIFEFINTQGWGELIPAVPVLVRQQMADQAFRGETVPVLKTDHLVRIPFETANYAHFRRLENPMIEFNTVDVPLKGSCVGAYSMRLGMRFSQSDEVVDYMTHKKKRRLFLRRQGRRLAQVTRFAAQVVQSLKPRIPVDGSGPEQAVVDCDDCPRKGPV